MHIQRHYSRAPITEAIIDFRVTLPEGLSVDKIAEIHAHVRDTFPTVEPFYKSVGAITYQPGSSFKVDTLEEQQIGFWLRSEDNLQTFQATLEGFTFNRLAPYKSWAEFSSNAQHLWDMYKEICKPTQVTRVAVRYINQINIPARELTELKDYLRTVPEVSPGLPQNALQSFFMQLQIPQQDLNCMLIINEAIAPPTSPEVVTVILDLDLFSQQIWETNDKEIWSFLEKLRHRKNKVFEESITDRTKELID
ncbi:MAG: TIGR04255 family protein [Chamaesiphon sp.]